jgi:hypothetical protein
MRRLFYCQANGVFGSFGDYVWARNKAEAAQSFRAQYGEKPTRIEARRLNP